MERRLTYEREMDAFLGFTLGAATVRPPYSGAKRPSAVWMPSRTSAARATARLVVFTAVCRWMILLIA
ncbi:hypothetical protein DFH01_09760 [Falsiroseomonas bella]|uniref:Uncharacterized protein n=1 Tax=Falsiroseomonas bella TaxID=2184016 RepID=A0A317FF22_9PROT|nr:hypothetical protein DFH01_09760 [Falsiroseomonas bella]